MGAVQHADNCTSFKRTFRDFQTIPAATMAQSGALIAKV
jgi:hypothetical protein